MAFTPATRGAVLSAVDPVTGFTTGEIATLVTVRHGRLYGINRHQNSRYIRLVLNALEQDGLVERHCDGKSPATWTQTF